MRNPTRVEAAEVAAVYLGGTLVMAVAAIAAGIVARYAVWLVLLGWQHAPGIT